MQLCDDILGEIAKYLTLEDIVKYNLLKFLAIRNDEKILIWKEAIKWKRINIIILLQRNKMHADLDEVIMNYAAELGSFKMIKFLCKLKFKMSDISIYHIISKGKFKILKWVFTNYHDDFEYKESLMDYAIKYNHLNIIKWLNKKKICGYSTTGELYAVQNGNIEIVKYLHEHVKPLWNIRHLIKLAESRNHLKLARYLYNIKKEINNKDVLCEICNKEIGNKEIGNKEIGNKEIYYEDQLFFA
jgi:hypothetical protein